MFDGFPPALEYDFYPFGNAYYNTSKCGGKTYSKDNMFCWVKQCGGDSPPTECFAGTPICQHGPGECLSNLYEACAVHYYEPHEYAPFVKCFEGDKKGNASFMGGCARYYNIDDKKIGACAANATLAAELNMKMAKATLKLGASKLGTPWVLINGQTVPSTDLPILLELVCEQMNPPPEGCSPGNLAAWRAKAKAAPVEEQAKKPLALC